MNIDAKCEELDFNYACKMAESQIMVECDVDTESKGGINKLLTATADVVINKVDAFVGEAKVYGRVCYRLVYLDGENALTSKEYCSDFEEDMPSSDITASSALMAHAKIEDIDSMVKGDTIRLQAVVSIELNGVYTQKADAITGVDGALTKVKDVKTSIHICHINDNIDISDEYNTGCNVDSVLIYHSAVELDNVKMNKDSIIVSGDATVCVTYMSDGKAYTKNLTIPYSDEVNALGADKTSVANIALSVQSTKIVIEGNEDDNSIKVLLDVKVEGDVFDYADKCVVEDVYSLEHELAIESSTIEYDRVELYKTLSERLQGEANIGDDAPLIGHIVYTDWMGSSMANTNVYEGEVVIDLLALVKVVYVNEGDEYCTLDMELPTSIKVPCEGITSDDKVCAEVVIESISARAKHERDIDIMAEVAISMRATRRAKESVVSKVEVLGDKVNRHKAMTLYFVQDGDSVWDIVKATGCCEQDIRAMNSDVDFDNLSSKDRILVMRHK